MRLFLRIVKHVNGHSLLNRYTIEMTKCFFGHSFGI